MSLDATALGTALTTSIQAALETAWPGNPCASDIANALGPGIANGIVAHFTANAVVEPGSMHAGGTAVTGTGTVA